MRFTKLDLNKYSRRQHFEYFCSLQYPYLGITNNVDVTELVEFCRKYNHSFYLVFIHLVALAADEISEFRQRINEKEIIEYDECPTSHIELLNDGTYGYCTLYHHMKFDEYMIYANEMRKKCLDKKGIKEDDDSNSMYFISTLPWIHYTSLIQPVAGGEESNPRITWGKFQEDYYGRKQLPVTVLVHHGLMDGIHIAQFYQSLEKQINELIYDK